MTDRVMIMQKGRIAEENKTNEVFKNPLSEYTKTLIANQPSKLNLQIKKTSCRTSGNTSTGNQSQQPDKTLPFS